MEKIYGDFARGDVQTALSACDDSITFQVPGKSPLAGKYSKENFASAFLERAKELTAGSLRTEVHDVLVSDRHAVALLSYFVKRKDEIVQLRMVHVWRFENGKPVAWYEYPRDLYQYDSIFT